MAVRIQIGLVIAPLFLLLAQSTTLVRFSFDDNLIEAGPDTFSVFQKGQGTVTLSTLNRFSGYRSVELRDVPGDHAFPELQGYFPLRAHGKLYLHFAIMTTDSSEELNIALAGPKWFTLRKDGIGFWLKTSGGYLTAISDSAPRKLFPMRPFVWYVTDATYDIDAGVYDLTIRQEGVEAPVFAGRGQPNAANQPGSRVDKFSFIGDHDTDESKVVYYVDDVLIGSDEAIVQQPFVAPGRRKLFFDYWNTTQRAQMRRPAPLPMMQLADLGIGPAETEALRADGAGELLGRSLSGPAPMTPDSLPGRSRNILESIVAWRAGTEALQSGEAEAALAHFDRASRLSPSARLFRMDAVMALAHLARWEEVDKRLAGIVPEWRGDPRLPVALALIGLAREDLDGAEQQLRVGAETNGIMAEQYFLVLLWKGEPTRAEQFAASMSDRAAAALDRSIWQERLGDAAFLGGNIERARQLYEGSVAGHPRPGLVWMKLADVYFKLGDFEKECTFRERIHGSLGGR